jgi:adenylate kinase family enzyme
MIIIISGPSHTGKTNLAQKLLEKYNYPYVSIDHIKMGLIRSGNTSLTPLSSDIDLTNYLWPIVREMIKTAIENNQNLIIEGCYIPFDWKKDFDERYINNIKEVWLIFSTNYIENNFDKILKFANVIEQRLDDSDLSIDSLIEDNKRILDGCISFNLNYVLIDDEYNILDSII